VKAQAVHTGIKLHPHGNRLIQMRRFQRRELFHAMHHGIKVMSRNQRVARQR
jgi:hypothetical protein